MLWGKAAISVTLFALGGLAAAEEPAEGPWGIPPEGSCTGVGTGEGSGEAGDVAPTGLLPGEVIGDDQMGRLRDHLPPEVWDYRERFFFKGMKVRHQAEVTPVLEHGAEQRHRTIDGVLIDARPL